MELPKKFKSKESDHVRYGFTSPSTGVKIKQDFYVSRAVALTGLIFANTQEGIKVLIAKRSKSMRDSPEMLGLPCGYLNWDETRHEGMMREVYEETSFYMPIYEPYLIYNNYSQPILTKDDPKELHQNISHIYISVYDFVDSTDFFMTEIEKFKCKETEWVKWLPIKEFFEKYYYKNSWAFGHNETINMGWKHWNDLEYNKK